MKEAIGPYRIQGVLGEGGMGIVYRGVHDNLARDVAVKALAPDLTRQPHFRERFFSEARTQARLLHPNIVAIYDLLEESGDYFIVMEFFEGQGLDAILAQQAGGAFAENQALPILAQVLAALDSAHSQGVIHRDVKPSNILVNGRGQAKLMDFGIALLVGDTRLTQSSQTIGTPVYMSPEQILRPREVDHRTDIYSTGIVLYELLAGQPPFDAETEYEIKKHHIETPPLEIERLRPELSAILAKALAKSPDDRFSSAGEFLRALQAAAPAAFAGDVRPIAIAATPGPPPPPPTVAAPPPTAAPVPSPPSVGPAGPGGLKKYWPILAALSAAALLAVVVLALFVIRSPGGGQRAESSANTDPPVSQTGGRSSADPGSTRPQALTTPLPTKPQPVSEPPVKPSAASESQPTSRVPQPKSSPTTKPLSQPAAPPSAPKPIPPKSPPAPIVVPPPPAPPPPPSPPPPTPPPRLSPPPPPPRRGVTLYQHGSFGGFSEIFYENDPDLSNNRIGNDEATSIRVDPGCTAILFKDINFGGKSMSVTRDMSEIGKPIKNDEVSSIQVFCK